MAQPRTRGYQINGRWDCDVEYTGDIGVILATRGSVTRFIIDCLNYYPYLHNYHFQVAIIR